MSRLPFLGTSDTQTIKSTLQSELTHAGLAVTGRSETLHEEIHPAIEIQVNSALKSTFFRTESSLGYVGPWVGYPEIRSFIMKFNRRDVGFSEDNTIHFYVRNALQGFISLLKKWVISSPDRMSFIPRSDGTFRGDGPAQNTRTFEGVSLPVPQGVKPTMTNRPTADADLMSLTFDVTDHEGNVLGMLTYGMRHAHGLDGITGVLDTLEHHASVFMPDPSFMAVRDRASAELLHRMLVATGMVSHHRLCGVVFVPSAGYPALELAATA